MRIIAEKDSSMHWAAWWENSPGEVANSASAFGAVAILILSSKGRQVSVRDLVADAKACDRWHIEMVVAESGGAYSGPSESTKAPQLENS